MGFDREAFWLHPSSLLFGVLASIRQFAVVLILTLVVAGSGDMVSLVVAGMVVVLAMLQVFLHYITFRYRLTDDALLIDEGWLFRRHRTIPANRIQNLELARNPLHHLFNVAEVRIETAGGSEPEAKLRVIGMKEVARLREAIFRFRHSEKPFTVDDVALDSMGIDASNPEDLSSPRHASVLVHEIPLSRLLLAGLLSNRGFLLLPLALGVAQQLRIDKWLDFEAIEQQIPRELSVFEKVFAGTAILLVLLILMRLNSMVWYAFRFYGYRMERFGEDLRVTCGFFTQRSATIPRHRIQLISVQQSILGRFFEIASVRIETAGGAGPNQAKEVSTIAGRWFLPVIKFAELQKILDAIREGLPGTLNDLPWHPPHPKTFRRMMRTVFVGTLLLGFLASTVWGAMGWTVWPFFCGIFTLVAHRQVASRRYARTDHAVVFRSGIFTRKLSMTFFDKVQNVEVIQSWFDRRWAMARLAVDTAASGPAQHRIEPRFLPEALAYSEYQSIAARIDQTPPTLDVRKSLAFAEGFVHGNNARLEPSRRAPEIHGLESQ